MSSSPRGVKQAVFAIWFSLVISVLSSVTSSLAGQSSLANLSGALLIYALAAVLTIKVAKGRNWARYVYLTVTCLSLLVPVFCFDAISSIDWLTTILLSPVEVFIIYRLFQAEASAWFAGATPLRA
ncbi:hypothetical protein [Chitinimonas sp.]|uniref:hypothetical protein n=1 Tax=Chitinimonas sp. TaxID=1934313 RepID=UPI0035B2C8B3